MATKKRKKSRTRKTKTVTTPRPRPSLRPASAFSLAFPLIVVLFFALCPPRLASAPQHAKEKPYALIAGTVWGPDDHPVYGVKVRMRRATDKPDKVRWELYSDHMGEFAQRLPAGEADYILWVDPKDLKDFKTKDGKTLRPVQEVTVHIYNDERADTGLHLTF